MVKNTHFIVVVKIGGLSMITTIQSLYKQIGRLLIFLALLAINTTKKYLKIFWKFKYRTILCL